MATKSSKHFCFSCDVDFTVKTSDEVTKLSVEFCPYCGEGIDPDDADVDEDGDEDSDENRW